MKMFLAKWWTSLCVLAVLAVVVALPLLFGASRPSAGADAHGDDRLVIFTPHNEQIRYEIARAFNAWREAQGKPPIYFDWRTSGGTSDLRKQIQDQFRIIASRGDEDQGIGYDLLFGGGDFEHNILAGGINVERDGQQVNVSITVPIDLSPEELTAIFPHELIGSEALYHPQLKWAGVVLSAFGIVYNNDLLAMQKLPPPETWADLTDARYQGAIALADPAHSGSIAVAYNTILRRYGWSEGWRILRRSFANARYFTNSASQVPIDVSSGQAMAGMCIDFYGRFQAGAIGRDRVGYVNPPFMTTITADPIAILRGAPHHDLAQEFVRWLLTADAQQLWQKKLGTEGGPSRYELRRMPVRRDVYTPANRAQWTDAVNPYLITRPFPHGMPDFYRTVDIVSHAMAIDVHDDLVAAWRAILAHPDHPRKAEMLELFDAMPPELIPRWPSPAMAAGAQEALADPGHPNHQVTIDILTEQAQRLMERWREPDRKLRDRLNWTMFFRNNYRRIVEIAHEDA